MLHKMGRMFAHFVNRTNIYLFHEVGKLHTQFMKWTVLQTGCNIYLYISLHVYTYEEVN